MTFFKAGGFWKLPSNIADNHRSGIKTLFHNWPPPRLNRWEATVSGFDAIGIVQEDQSIIHIVEKNVVKRLNWAKMMAHEDKPT